MGPGTPGLEPGHRPAAGRRRRRGVGAGRADGGPRLRRHGNARRTAGDRAQRGAARPAGQHDPAPARRAEGHQRRPGSADRPRGRRRPMAGRDGRGHQARPGRPGGIGRRCRRRRLHARRRPQLAGALARLRGAKRGGIRGRHRGRAGPPRRRRAPPGPVLGAARRRRDLRDRDRAGVPAVPVYRGAGGHAAVPHRARRGRAARMAAVHPCLPSADHLGRPHPAVPAGPGHAAGLVRAVVRRRRTRSRRCPPGRPTASWRRCAR